MIWIYKVEKYNARQKFYSTMYCIKIININKKRYSQRFFFFWISRWKLGTWLINTCNFRFWLIFFKFIFFYYGIFIFTGSKHDYAALSVLFIQPLSINSNYPSNKLIFILLSWVFISTKLRTAEVIIHFEYNRKICA